MTSQRRNRNFDTMEGRKNNSFDTGRKEASIFGKLDSNDSSAHPISADPEQRSKARRRRIYENEYNRPYPSRKKIHLWTRSEQSLTREVASLITPSPARKFDRDWISNVSDDRPHDEIADCIYPRALWCSSRHDDHDITEQGLSEVDVPMSRLFAKRPTSEFGTKSRSEFIMRTPKRQVSSSLSSSISPISTPHPQTTMCDGYSMNACLPVPSAPTKETLGQLRPMMEQSAPSVRSHWQETAVEEQEIEMPVDVPAEEHKHNESHRKLQKFLRSGNESQLKLFIDDYQVSIFDRIVESFYGNTKLKTLIIHRNMEGNPGTIRTTSEMFCLFEAIRCMPYLKVLVVSNVRKEVLPALLDNLPSSLRKFNLQVIDGGIPNDFLDALARMHLKHVQLEAEESVEIGRLVHSSSIQSIKLCGVRIPMDPNHLQNFADALSCNLESPLKSLDLQPWIDFSSWKYLAEALRFNTSIQFIRVSFLGETCDEANAAAMVLAELLLANTTLTHIGNYTHDAVIVSEDTATGPVLDALKANTKLRKFRFFEEDTLFWMAKDALLKRNIDSVNEGDECSKAFLDQYVSLTSILPSIKQKVCGYC